ncbi:hypothetical protein OHS49_000808 [Salmonella enterica]|nr:hypothetical protein [Salmonella enterica]
MSKEKQTVNGDVGNVVSGDVTIHNYSGEVTPAAQQPMSLLQKSALHRLMDELVDAGESKRELWIMLHARLNTTTVSEMTAADYHQAVEILEESARRIKYLKDSNILISKIMGLTDPAYRVDRDRYCLKHFGTTHLKGLDKEQLQGVFGYFDDLLNSGREEKSAPSEVSSPSPGQSTQSGNKKIYVIVGVLIIVIAATMLGVTRFSGNGSAAGHRSENPTVFTADTSDSVIASSIPALRSIFPGLNKYSGDFISVSTYKQKTGWHTLKFSVSSQSAVPESYAVRGKTCYININPDGSYARVLTAPCRSLLLDQQSTPGSKYRFILK